MKTISICFAILAVPCTVGSARAQGHPFVTAIAIDPNAPSTLYLGTFNDGAFKSVNGGNDWTRIGLRDDAFWGPAIAVDPVDGNIVYAGNGSRVFKSKDGGVTWIDTVGGRGWDGAVWSLFQDFAAATGQTLYATTWFGVYKSTDGTRTWEWVELPAFHRLLVTALTRSRGLTYLCAPERLGILASADEVKWAPDDDGIENYLPFAIVNDQRNILYAGLCGGPDAGGVYTKPGGEIVWARTALRDHCVVSIAVDPVDPDVLYAGAGNLGLYPEGGIFKSENRGAEWTSIGLRFLSVDALAIDPSDSNIIYAATNHGLFKSVNGGADWQVVF